MSEMMIIRGNTSFTRVGRFRRALQPDFRRFPGLDGSFGWLGLAAVVADATGMPRLHAFLGGRGRRHFEIGR